MWNKYPETYKKRTRIQNSVILKIILPVHKLIFIRNRDKLIFAYKTGLFYYECSRINKKYYTGSL
ncbi:Hypothetical protein PEIBARAKI_6018 [Petrimonas sp. IBARAKI]|nr:Hypothetical protein PEIBARAKI_6018 [Petrimonas sp. IBARAKI]